MPQPIHIHPPLRIVILRGIPMVRFNEVLHLIELFCPFFILCHYLELNSKDNKRFPFRTISINSLSHATLVDVRHKHTTAFT